MGHPGEVSGWPGWRNGRRRGLKPLGRETSVRVRVPPRARREGAGLAVLKSEGPDG